MHAVVTLGDKRQGFNLKKANNGIFDSAWIAGVDYDGETSYDVEYEKENDTDDGKKWRQKLQIRQYGWEQVSRYSTRTK